jgi:hypothetical protein
LELLGHLAFLFSAFLQCQFSNVMDAWCYGAKPHWRRRFCSNLPPDAPPLPVQGRNPDPFPTVLASEYKYSANSKDRRRAGRKIGRRRTLEEVSDLMGLPPDYATPALTVAASYAVRGNGVPLPMGRAVAKAVALATGEPGDS